VEPTCVHLVDALAPALALVFVTSRLVEVAVLRFTVGGVNAHAQLVVRALARLKPRVAVRRLDGHALDLPPVLRPVRARRGLVVAVIVFPPLTEVVVALVETTFLDEKRLARARKLTAPGRGVAVGVKVSLLRVADAVVLLKKKQVETRKG